MGGYRARAALVLLMAAAWIAGCAPKEKKYSQGIMPVALNFYVLTGEIIRLRDEVKAASPEKLADFPAKYQELITRSQQLDKEAASLPEMKKHADFQASLDSCLASQVEFLQTEAGAVRSYSSYKNAQKQISVINQQISGNTLALARNRAELDRLNSLAAKSLKEVEAVKANLLSFGQRNLVHMKAYNQLVLSQKILNYTSPEELFKLTDWEKAKPAAPKPKASKARSTKKRRR